MSISPSDHCLHNFTAKQVCHRNHKQYLLEGARWDIHWSEVELLEGRFFRIIVSDESLLVWEHFFLVFKAVTGKSHKAIPPCWEFQRLPVAQGKVERPEWEEWQKAALICHLYLFPGRYFVNPEQDFFFVQVPRSQVRNVLNLERKTILLLGFFPKHQGLYLRCANKKRQWLSALAGQDITCVLAPLVSCVPITHLGVCGGGMSPNVEFGNPLSPQEIRAGRKSDVPSLAALNSAAGKIVGEEAPKKFGASTPCWSFNAPSQSLLSKFPPALLIFSVPHLPGREQCQCCGCLRISVFVEVQAGQWHIKQREVTQFSVKKGRQLPCSSG